MKLSDRIRPGVECAPWVYDEVCCLEAERDRLAGENRKLHSAHQRIYFYQQDVGHPPLHSVAEGMRMIAHAALAADGGAEDV